MLDKSETFPHNQIMASFLSSMQAPPRSVKESLTAATFFAAQVAAAAGVLSVLYHALDVPGLSWAIVTAVMVLYPGVAQSFSAALLRLAANLLGCGVGFVVGYFLGQSTWQVIVALVVVIYFGELLRMDLALRTACVATIIVMTGLGHSLEMTVLERVAAVLVGGVAAIAIQLAVLPLRKYLDFVPHAGASPQSPRDGARE